MCLEGARIGVGVKRAGEDGRMFCEFSMINFQFSKNDQCQNFQTVMIWKKERQNLVRIL
jgi:hypothetical protein